MKINKCIADLRAVLDEEIAHARHAAIADLLTAAELVREASNDAERSAAFEEAGKRFAREPVVLRFLKTLAPPPKPSNEEQHLRARRFARVQVAEIQLYHAAAIKSARASGDIYTALKSQMDAAREAYRVQFLTPVNGTADYLHGEFVRTLANEDAALLGPGYPGPLV